MANALAFSFSAPIRASSESLKRPDPHRKNPVSSSSWWTPLFGWSSNPDYLNDSNVGNTSETKPGISDSGRPRCKCTLGSFTEEKARQLRKKTMENSSFHDMMYHSAIASRLASDISEKWLKASKGKNNFRNENVSFTVVIVVVLVRRDFGQCLR